VGQGPIAAGPVAADRNQRGAAETYPGDIALSASLGWADPLANRIDANVLAGITWTGMDPARPIDQLGLGATYAHFCHDAVTLYNYELAIELFYRIRFTQFISLSPDVQYIIHPNGSGTYTLDQSDRHNALAATVRLEISF
jgi:carbohydrate-selective porin OprB